MNRQARGTTSRGAFRLVTQIPPPDRPANPTSLPAAAPTLSQSTRAYLDTLLTLCASITAAAAAELYLKSSTGWLTLAKCAQGPDALGHLQDSALDALDRPGEGRRGPGLYVLRITTKPVIALAMVVDEAISPATGTLLSRALQMVLPLLHADEAEHRARRTRSRLLNVQAELAHELRTPLTAISGFAQLLQRPGSLDERRRRAYAGVAVTESQQATAIIDHMIAALQAEAEALAEGEEAPATGEGSATSRGAQS